MNEKQYFRYVEASSEEILMKYILRERRNFKELNEFIEQLEDPGENQKFIFGGNLVRYTKKYGADLYTLMKELQNPDILPDGLRKYELLKLRRKFIAVAGSLRTPNGASTP